MKVFGLNRISRAYKEPFKKVFKSSFVYNVPVGTLGKEKIKKGFLPSGKKPIKTTKIKKVVNSAK